VGPSIRSGSKCTGANLVFVLVLAAKWLMAGARCFEIRTPDCVGDLYFLFLQFGADPVVSSKPSYTISVTKKTPANLAHLFAAAQAAGLNTSGVSAVREMATTARAAATPMNYWGGGYVALKYSLNESFEAFVLSVANHPCAILARSISSPTAAVCDVWRELRCSAIGNRADFCHQFRATNESLD